MKSKRFLLSGVAFLSNWLALSGSLYIPAPSDHVCCGALPYHNYCVLMYCVPYFCVVHSAVFALTFVYFKNILKTHVRFKSSCTFNVKQ